MKINPKFILRNIHDTYMLIPIRKNELTKNPIALNYSAAVILEACSKCNSKEDLLLYACNTLHLPHDSNRNSMLNYIHFLLDKNIICEESEESYDL